MEEGLKTRLLISSVILNVIFIVSSFSFGASSGKNYKRFQDELRVRLETEEQMVNLEREKNSWDSKEKSFQEKITTQQRHISDLSGEFEDLKDSYKELQNEYDKLSKLKDVLEENLKDELAKNSKVRIEAKVKD